MHENEVASKVLKAAFEVHSTLGPGLLETVYETALYYELSLAGLYVERQKAVPLIYKGNKLEDGFRADLIVERCVEVELKSIELVPSVAYKILLSHLRLADLRLGLLINFGEEHLKNGIKRVVNGLT